jgi:hypothetical protein
VTKSIGLEDLHTWEKLGLPNQRRKEEKEQNSNHCLQCFLVSGPSIYHVLQRNEVITVYSCTMCFVCTISTKSGLMDISWLHHLWWFQKDIGLCPYQNSRKVWTQKSTMFGNAYMISASHLGLFQGSSRNCSEQELTQHNLEAQWESLWMLDYHVHFVRNRATCVLYIVPGI